MVMVKLGRAVVTALLIGMVVAPQASADSLRATLDGKRIRIERVASLNCHDFDYPTFRCFSSIELLADDIAARLAAKDAVGAQLLQAGYVTAYADAWYGTPLITLANDQTSLSAIGWNDRISSFKSFGASGTFREHSPSGGASFGYGPTTQAGTLGGSNDTFSAFYND
jgi:hypothetical protein